MCPPTPPGRAPRPRVRFGRSAPRSASLFPVRPSLRGSPTAPPGGSLASALKRISRRTCWRHPQFRGWVISGLREQGTGGELGDLGPQVVHALSEAFASATQWSLITALGFLTIGLLGAFRVRSAALRTDQAGS